jgi:ParB family chromosome partitioning protein
MTNTKTRPKAPAKSTTPGLERLGDLSSLLNPVAHTAPTGAPLELPLDAIEPDPSQPRRDGNPGYTHESLKELAETIKARGVKSPISVREHPTIPNRYYINHGERRWRASKIAGRNTIRAFVDNDFEDSDQVVENLQRVDLTARELADWIGRKLSAGLKKIEIARLMGKSPAFVTQHVTLLDLPEPIAEVFNSGRVNDVTVVNDLVVAYRKSPEKTIAWIADGQELNRSSMKMLRDYVDNTVKPLNAPEPAPKAAQAAAAPASAPSPGPSAASMPATASAAKARLRQPVLRVVYDDRRALLLLDRVPTSEGRAWVKVQDTGEELDADMRRITLVALHEG